MKLKNAMPCLIIFLFACSGLKSGMQTGQGLSGYIYLLRGNQMPSPGRAVSKGRGVSREVFIYEPTTTGQTTGSSPTFNRINTRLITQAKSDTTGHYSINLPAGKYSVFIKQDGKFFAAESDGTGTLNPVQIGQNVITKKDFTINNNAAY
jgi:hypothetical protein